MRTDGTWTGVHLLYPDTRSRLELLAVHASDLVAPAATWFFADLRSADGEKPGIVEIGILEGSTEASVSLIQAASDSDLVIGAVPVGRPRVFDEGLFPSGRVPAVYGRGLALGTARSLVILRAVHMSGSLMAPLSSVRAELLDLYGSFFPDRKERRAAMKEHIAWLRRVDGKLNRSESDSRVVHDSDAVLTVMEEMPGYARLSELLRSSSDTTVVTARLAHAQVVRLLGPDNGDPRIEMGILQSILDREDTSETHMGASTV